MLTNKFNRLGRSTISLDLQLTDQRFLFDNLIFLVFVLSIV